MKKNILSIFAVLLFISCSNDSSDNSSNGTIKWKFKANGVQYEWRGNYPYTFSSGQSSDVGVDLGVVPTILLSSPTISGAREIMLTFTFPSQSTGTFNLNNSVPGNSVSLVMNNNLYSTIPNLGEIILNISQIATSTGGITKGTFSGTMVSASQQMQTIQITDGSFEAIRL
jgi:hypothetical protein